MHLLFRLTLYGFCYKFAADYFGRPADCTIFFYEDAIDIRIQPIYMSLKCRKLYFLTLFFFGQWPSAQKMSRHFSQFRNCQVVIGNLILFFLNKFKSTATIVTPKFRFILLKIFSCSNHGKFSNKDESYFDTNFSFVTRFQKHCYQKNSINLLQIPIYSDFKFEVKMVFLKVIYKSNACMICSSTCKSAIFYKSPILLISVFSSCKYEHLELSFV